jgi:hypothetical protein
VEAMQASLRTETDILRRDIASERQRLRDDRAQFEAERRDLVQKLTEAREQAEVCACVCVCVWHRRAGVRAGCAACRAASC